MTHLAAHIARQLPALANLRTDGELLAAFLADREEAAFAEIVRRHGPLVWGACRRLLPDPADAEDAFQASFLVLVRRARRLTGRAALGPWLYRVAVWTARNVRRRNARTFARRAPLSPATTDPAPGPTALDLRADLDGALLSLPEKYRTPLVLCHLQGWSRREAAARLGCPEGTLSSLLSRGLARLRAKLGGHDPAKVLAMSGTAPAVLAAATVRAAAAVRFAAAGAISSSVFQLAEGVLRMFWVKKATAASFALVAVFGMGLGVGVSVQQIPGAAAGDGQGPTAKAAPVPPNQIAVIETKLNAAKNTRDAAKMVAEQATEGAKLCREKIKRSRVAWENKTGSLADYLQDQTTLARFEENLAQALQKIAAADAEIKELESQLKTLSAPPKPGPKPATQEDRLRTELERAKAEAERAEQQLKQLQLEWEKQRDEFGKVLPALLHPNGYLDLTVGTKDAAWPYQVREYGRDGKPVGTVVFENVEVLGRFLARTAKDPTGPRDVRITTRADVKADLVKSAISACQAAGLKTSAGTTAVLTLLQKYNAARGNQRRAYTKELDRLLNEYKNPADADAFKQRVEELNRQRKELQELKELAEKSRQKEREDRDRQIEKLNKLIENMRQEREGKSKPVPPAKRP